MSKVSKVVGSGLLAGMLLVGPAAVNAADVTIGADVASSYVWRGITINEDAVIQPSVLVEHDSGFALEVWANFDLGDDDGAFAERQFSEINFDISYTLDLDVASVTLGYIEYMFPGDGDISVDEDGGASGVAAADRDIYVSVGTEVVGLGIDLTLYQGASSSDATYIVLAADYGYEVIDNLTLGINGSIAWGGKGATASGDDGMHDYLIGLTADYEVMEGLEVGLFANYVGSLDSDVLPSEAVREDFVGGLGVYYTF